MLDSEAMVDLAATARALAATPKGILAADESTPTADKRLAAYGIPTNEEMRRQYRDLFLSAPGIEQYLSGVILYEETLSQKNADGVLFTEALAALGVMPGIKVDQGTEAMEGSPDEVITKGLLGLSDRLHGYRDAHGTRFTKWRAVIRIDGDRLPTSACVVENAKRLAMGARCVQEAGMVPILEPEVLYDGTHSRVRAKEVITETLTALMKAVDEHGVDPSGMIIKTSMALSGKESKKTDAPEEVAEDTLAALTAAVPGSVPGIVFLSGGQGNDQSTDNLRAIGKRASGAPWKLTFSFARTLQDEGLKAWAGKSENVPAAREAFLARLKAVSAATTGA